MSQNVTFFLSIKLYKFICIVTKLSQNVTKCDIFVTLEERGGNCTFNFFLKKKQKKYIFFAKLSQNCHKLSQIVTNCHKIVTKLSQNCHKIVTKLSLNYY